MLAPTIHMNGTSRKELQSLNMSAYLTLQAAAATLAKAVPNGRDYYPQGAGAIVHAMREHRQRLSMLQACITEIETILESLV